MEYTNIKLEKENSVATVRLNRPEVLNALNPELLAEFSCAVTEVGEDEEVKVLVVRGEGSAFCAGADLTYFQTALSAPDRLSEFITRLNGCLFQLEELPLPVIALVHGFALAGGLELVLACDMAIAAEDARIGDQHVKFGWRGYPTVAAPGRDAARDGAFDYRPLVVGGRSGGLGSGVAGGTDQPLGPRVGGVAGPAPY